MRRAGSKRREVLTLITSSLAVSIFQTCFFLTTLNAGVPQAMNRVVVQQGSLVGYFVDGQSYDVLTTNETSGAFDTSATTVATTPTEKAAALELDSVTPNADENPAELIGQFQQLPPDEHSEALQELGPQTLADIRQVSLDISQQYVRILQEQEREKSVALELDSVTANTGGNLTELIGQFQQLPLGKHSEALQELSPQTFANIGHASLDISLQYVGVLQERMNRLRSVRRYAEALEDDEPIQLAFGGSLADLKRILMETDDTKIAPCGFWTGGFGQWGDQKSRRGQAGYDFNQGSTAVGFDYAFSDDFLAGISANYSYTDFNINRGLGHGIIDGYGGSVYGSWLFGKGGYVEGSLSYARQHYDTNRLITVGPITTMASGKHYGNAYSASLGGGYDISLSKWTVGPFGSLNYTRLEEDGFTESGSGVALRVSDRKTDNLVSNLGVRLARPVELRRGLLVPEITASWLHDFAIDDNVVTASFADAPGAPFSIRGPRTERDGMSLGAGLKFLQRGGFSCGIQYNTELREGFTAHRVAGQIRFEFGRKQ